MKALTLRLPDEVHEALRREAFQSRRSMNDLVLEALSDRATVWDDGFLQGAHQSIPNQRQRNARRLGVPDREPLPGGE